MTDVAVEALCERVDMFHALTWRQVVELVEQLATGVDPLADSATPVGAAE